MVSVVVPKPDELDAWLDDLAKRLSPDEVAVVGEAALFAQDAHGGQTRASGEPVFQYLLAAADIVAGLRMDHETIAATFLHDVVDDTDVSLDELKQQFGDAITGLVGGVSRMDIVAEVTAGDGTGERGQFHVDPESLRKMLLAMAEDIRVVIIKLAERLHNMRTLSALPRDRQIRVARETRELFAPLANRLGIWQIKWELEDLSFRYLQPDTYKHIAGLLAEKRSEREQYITDFVRILQAELEKSGIKAEVNGRSKHIYSIWKKMQRKQLDFDQLYDIRAVRILADQVADCYGALGVVHTLWPYIKSEFDDYIATPKENNYQSIHTAVIGPGGKTVEVQIRTRQMHQESELGVAAHWRYKEGKKADQAFDEKIQWLRQLLEWKDELADAGDFVDQFKSEVLEDRIYVFTPAGKVIDLPRGATPVDFAYAIHTQVGHRCRGARVDGKMVQLTYALKTGQRVEIITVKQGGPSRDWLNPHLGYIATTRARSRIQSWWREQNLDESIAAGRALLDRELERLGGEELAWDSLAKQLDFNKVDDMLAALGRSELKPARVARVAQKMLGLPEKTEQPALKETVQKTQRRQAAGIHVDGVSGLVSQVAKCCKPLPGEPVKGYITRGKGVTIHRAACPNLLHYLEQSPERVIDVEWGAKQQENWPVDVQVTAVDRPGLLRDITALLADEKINVMNVKSQLRSRDQSAHMRLTLELPDMAQLDRVLSQIGQLPNIIDVRRAGS
ncbi:MAG: GTP diphosphokinase [Gammaproteobacteria bacterium]|nr:MAG: GTP diphosphokinase [Gammaproteobacteria bacterium]